MQKLFADRTDWHTPWIARVTPRLSRLVAHRPDRTIFTRFVPPHRTEDAPGNWRRYYERWRSVTGEKLEARLLDLVPALRDLAPAAPVFDKTTYSPWITPDLLAHLRRDAVDTLVVSGAETDVCVLATVLGAVDHGFRTILPTDAICSSTDATHDALLALYNQRFSQQIETASVDEVIEHWR